MRLSQCPFFQTAAKIWEQIGALQHFHSVAFRRVLEEKPGSNAFIYPALFFKDCLPVLHLTTLQVWTRKLRPNAD